jgi:hypothetical protein
LVNGGRQQVVLGQPLGERAEIAAVGDDRQLGAILGFE